MDALFRTDRVELHPGISYRHCLVLRQAETGARLTPPHDISGRPVRDFLPQGENSALLRDMMERSFALLREHPVNLARVRAGKNPANCLWFWGEGRKPALRPFRELYGVEKGGVISAVDLIRGIGRCAGLDVLPVDGRITGTYETDFAAKGRAAIRAFQQGYSFVYLHMEAPDECGHHGQVKEKIFSIEEIDRKVITPVLDYLRSTGEPFTALVMPDHPTPLSIRTHVSDPVPFALLDSRTPQDHPGAAFTEVQAKTAGLLLPQACSLMGRLVR